MVKQLSSMKLPMSLSLLSVTSQVMHRTAVMATLQVPDSSQKVRRQVAARGPRRPASSVLTGSQQASRQERGAINTSITACTDRSFA